MESGVDRRGSCWPINIPTPASLWGDAAPSDVLRLWQKQQRKGPGRLLLQTQPGGNIVIVCRWQWLRKIHPMDLLVYSVLILQWCWSSMTLWCCFLFFFFTTAQSVVSERKQQFEITSCRPTAQWIIGIFYKEVFLVARCSLFLA